MMLASTEERECSYSLTLMASSSVPDWNPPFGKSSYDPENFITQWFKSTAGKYIEFILDTILSMNIHIDIFKSTCRSIMVNIISERDSSK